MSFCKKMIATTGEDSKAGQFGVLILRVFAGLTMALAHGMGKFPMSDMMVDGVRALGFPMPEVFAYAAALAELVGGLLIAVGLLTRPAAIGLAFTMAVAAFGAHAADPFQVKEMAFLYLFVSLFFAFYGPGRLSVDFFLNKKCK
jgi:putative oxidoreductase